MSAMAESSIAFSQPTAAITTQRSSGPSHLAELHPPREKRVEQVPTTTSTGSSTAHTLSPAMGLLDLQSSVEELSIISENPEDEEPSVAPDNAMTKDNGRVESSDESVTHQVLLPDARTSTQIPALSVEAPLPTSGSPDVLDLLDNSQLQDDSSLSEVSLGNGAYLPSTSPAGQSDFYRRFVGGLNPPQPMVAAVSGSDDSDSVNDVMFSRAPSGLSASSLTGRHSSGAVARAASPPREGSPEKAE